MNLAGYTTFTLAASDPWLPYSKQPAGKGKNPGVVPESGLYGLGLVGLCLLFVLVARFDREKPSVRR